MMGNHKESVTYCVHVIAEKSLRTSKSPAEEPIRCKKCHSVNEPVLSTWYGLLRNQRWLQSSTTCHCKQAHNTFFSRCHQIENNWTKELYFDHLPLGQRTRRPERQWEGRLLGQNSRSYNTTIAYDAISINRGKQILEDYYIKIWNATYVSSANASHTKLYIPTMFHRLSLPLWPNFILTQFLTNHGSFRPYLHKMNKTSSPTCSCPEKAVQTSHHLMTECSLFSRERPTVLQTLPPPLVLKYHINAVGVTSFLRNIFHTLQEQLKGNQTP